MEVDEAVPVASNENEEEGDEVDFPDVRLDELLEGFDEMTLQED
jgi:nonsense-mediated mRNA decay protein 3